MAKTRKKPNPAHKRKLANKKHADRLERLVGPPKILVDLMRSTKQRGNPKDFVLISGASIMDYWGSVPIPEAIGPDVLLVHKSKLHEVFGEELGKALADVFWNKTTNRRRNRSPKRRIPHVNP